VQNLWYNKEQEQVEASLLSVKRSQQIAFHLHCCKERRKVAGGQNNQNTISRYAMIDYRGFVVGEKFV
jgi:hypothetical protein